MCNCKGTPCFFTTDTPNLRSYGRKGACNRQRFKSHINRTDRFVRNGLCRGPAWRPLVGAGGMAARRPLLGASGTASAGSRRGGGRARGARGGHPRARVSGVPGNNRKQRAPRKPQSQRNASATFQSLSNPKSMSFLVRPAPFRRPICAGTARPRATSRHPMRPWSHLGGVT